jgi:hypothetical protein
MSRTYRLCRNSRTLLILQYSDLASRWKSRRHLWTAADAVLGCSHILGRRSDTDLRNFLRSDGLWTHYLWVWRRFPVVSDHWALFNSLQATQQTLMLAATPKRMIVPVYQSEISEADNVSMPMGYLSCHADSFYNHSPYREESLRVSNSPETLLDTHPQW